MKKGVIVLVLLFAVTAAFAVDHPARAPDRGSAPSVDAATTLEVPSAIPIVLPIAVPTPVIESNILLTAVDTSLTSTTSAEVSGGSLHPPTIAAGSSCAPSTAHHQGIPGGDPLPRETAPID